MGNVIGNNKNNVMIDIQHNTAAAVAVGATVAHTTLIQTVDKFEKWLLSTSNKKALQSKQFDRKTFAPISIWWRRCEAKHRTQCVNTTHCRHKKYAICKCVCTYYIEYTQWYNEVECTRRWE